MTGCFVFDDDQEALNQDGAKIIASFPSDMWKTRDKRCIDAVKRLLDLDPKKRLTAEQFCNHEWLKRGHDVCAPQIQEKIDKKPNADSLQAEQLAQNVKTQTVETTNERGTPPANVEDVTSSDMDVADKVASTPSEPATANFSESGTNEVSNALALGEEAQVHETSPKEA